VRLLSPNGKDTKTFVFTKIETNVHIPDDRFKIETPETWNVIRVPNEKKEPASAPPAH
jgi:outer membrane lipoprotein-sorting protein